MILILMDDVGFVGKEMENEKEKNDKYTLYNCYLHIRL